MGVSLGKNHFIQEVQGLRALSVLLVLLYHLQIPWVSGGFVGVDVFFVISGFLITRNISEEILSTGGLNIWRFYLNRAFRLLPAQFVVLVVSLLFASLLFSPDDFLNFGGSMLSSLFSVSNVFFWGESGYFSSDAMFKPLLHTWSLGIEMQFYAVWPVLMLWGLRSSKALGFCIFGSLGGLSFLLNAAFLDWDASGFLGSSLPQTTAWLREAPVTVFYLMPFRFFEFLLGAAVVWIARVSNFGRVSHEIFMFIGLALIGFAAFAYDRTTVFPYWNALIPCLGAALVICGRHSPFLGSLLRMRPAMWLGSISYSLYLVSWPLGVFYQYVMREKFGVFDEVLILICSVGLGYGLFRLVESPLRNVRRANAHTVLLSFGACFGVIGLLSVSACTGDGWRWRIPVERRAKTDAELRAEESHIYCNNLENSKPVDLFTCQNWRGKERDIIVWGDSHARNLIAGISEAYPEYNVYIMYLSGCNPQSGFGGYVREMRDGGDQSRCVQRNKAALDFLKSYRSSTVLLASAKRDNPILISHVTNNIIAELKAAGHTPIAIGDWIRPSKPLGGCWQVPVLIPESLLVRRCSPDLNVVADELAYNEQYAKNTSEFADISSVQCEGGVCDFRMDGVDLFRDHHHLSWMGSIVLVNKLKPILSLERRSAQSGNSPVFNGAKR